MSKDLEKKQGVKSPKSVSNRRVAVKPSKKMSIEETYESQNRMPGFMQADVLMDMDEESLERRQEDLRKELANLKKNPDAPSIIEESLRDKLPSYEKEFLREGSKTKGYSSGYIAKERASGDTFLLKAFDKRAKYSSLASDQRQDAINELISAPMYQFLLYDRAPKEQLVMSDKDDRLHFAYEEGHSLHVDPSLHVRSKFLKDVKQLDEFAGRKPNKHNNPLDVFAMSGDRFLDPSNPRLKQIIGFEKVIAACHMLGERDYHTANLMVTKDNIVAKVDHGKTFTTFYKNFSSMIRDTYVRFSGHEYSDAIEKGNLKFDVREYSKSLNQMLSQLTEDQIDVIIDQRVAQLKEAGFDPKGLSIANLDSEIPAIIDQKVAELKKVDFPERWMKDIMDSDIKINSFEDLEKFCKKECTRRFGKPNGELAIIDRNIEALKEKGFNPNGLSSTLQKGRIDIISFDDLEKSYKEAIKENLKNMGKIAKEVEIISAFVGVDERFKEGGWLEAFAKSGKGNPMSPIEYAIKNGITIDNSSKVLGKDDVTLDYLKLAMSYNNAGMTRLLASLADEYIQTVVLKSAMENFTPNDQSIYQMEVLKSTRDKAASIENLKLQIEAETVTRDRCWYHPSFDKSIKDLKAQIKAIESLGDNNYMDPKMIGFLASGVNESVQIDALKSAMDSRNMQLVAILAPSVNESVQIDTLKSAMYSNNLPLLSALVNAKESLHINAIELARDDNNIPLSIIEFLGSIANEHIKNKALLSAVSPSENSAVDLEHLELLIKLDDSAKNVALNRANKAVNLDCIEVLIEQGATAKIAALNKAMDGSNIELIDFLARKCGPEIEDLLKNNKPVTIDALTKAIDEQDLDHIKLFTRLASDSIKDEAVVYATRSKDVSLDCMKMLIDQGALVSVNALNNAINSRNLEMIRFVAKHANEDIKNQALLDAPLLDLLIERTQGYPNLLERAIDSGNIRMVSIAAFDSYDYLKNEALLYAVKNKNVKLGCIEELIDQGAVVSINVLNKAMEVGNAELISFLASRCDATINDLVNNHRPVTIDALNNAIVTENVDRTCFLSRLASDSIKTEALLNIAKNKDIIFSWRGLKCVELLIDQGAKVTVDVLNNAIDSSNRQIIPLLAARCSDFTKTESLLHVVKNRDIGLNGERLNCINELIDQGAKVAANVLNNAIDSSNAVMIRLLVDKCSDSITTESLVYATKNKDISLDCIEALIKPYTRLVSGEALNNAIDSGNIEMVKLLSKNSSKSIKNVALLNATKNKDVSLNCIEALINNGAEVSVEALNNAIDSGNGQMVKLLARSSVRYIKDSTLLNATKNKDVSLSCIEALINNGATVPVEALNNAIDSNNVKVIKILASSFNDSLKTTALAYALKYKEDRSDCIKELVSSGATVTIEVLNKVIESNNNELAGFLASHCDQYINDVINKGAKVTAHALNKAISDQNINLAKVLSKYCTQDIKTEALYYAIQRGDIEFAKIFLDNNTQITADILKKVENAELIKILIPYSSQQVRDEVFLDEVKGSFGYEGYFLMDDYLNLYKVDINCKSINTGKGLMDMQIEQNSIDGIFRLTKYYGAQITTDHIEKAIVNKNINTLGYLVSLAPSDVKNEVLLNAAKNKDLDKQIMERLINGTKLNINHLESAIESQNMRMIRALSTKYYTIPKDKVLNSVSSGIKDPNLLTYVSGLIGELYGMEQLAGKAIKEHNATLLKMLIEGGFDVNSLAIGDDKNAVPIFFAVMHSNSSDTSMIDILLDTGKVDLNQRRGDRHNTLLHCLIEKKPPNIPLIEKVCGLGADVTLKNLYNETALDLARASGSLEVVQILEDIEITINIKKNDNWSRTWLHSLVTENPPNIKLIQKVCDLGGNLSMRDAWGRTPLEKARKHGTPEVVEILKKAILKREVMEIKNSVKKQVADQTSTPRASQEVLNAVKEPKAAVRIHMPESKSHPSR